MQSAIRQKPENEESPGFCEPRAKRVIGSGDGNSKQLIATFASIPTSTGGPGFRVPQAGSSPQPSASSPLSNSLSAIAQKHRRNESIWVSRCFSTAHVLTEGGTP